MFISLTVSFPSGSSWEVNTTNLEKNLDALPPATNVSVRVKAFNEVGISPPHDPVFCVTEDDGKMVKGLTVYWFMKCVEVYDKYFVLYGVFWLWLVLEPYSYHTIMSIIPFIILKLELGCCFKKDSFAQTSHSIGSSTLWELLMEQAWASQFTHMERDFSIQLSSPYTLCCHLFHLSSFLLLTCISSILFASSHGCYSSCTCHFFLSSSRASQESTGHCDWPQLPYCDLVSSPSLYWHHPPLHPLFCQGWPGKLSQLCTQLLGLSTEKCE